MKTVQGVDGIIFVCQSQLDSKAESCFVFDALNMRCSGLNVADLQVIFDTMNNVSFCENISKRLFLLSSWSLLSQAQMSAFLFCKYEAHLRIKMFKENNPSKLFIFGLLTGK